jgi:hypothetical protein
VRGAQGHATVEQMEQPRTGPPDRGGAAATSVVEVALIDAAVDSYVDWREESAAVRRAYRCWAGAARADRPGAFAAYVAALDQEERAGTRYAQVIAYFDSVRLDRSPARPRTARRLGGLRSGRRARP